MGPYADGTRKAAMPRGQCPFNAGPSLWREVHPPAQGMKRVETGRAGYEFARKTGKFITGVYTQKSSISMNELDTLSHLAEKALEGRITGALRRGRGIWLAGGNIRGVSGSIEMAEIEDRRERATQAGQRQVDRLTG